MLMSEPSLPGKPVRFAAELGQIQGTCPFLVGWHFFPTSASFSSSVLALFLVESCAQVFLPDLTKLCSNSAVFLVEVLLDNIFSARGLPKGYYFIKTSCSVLPLLRLLLVLSLAESSTCAALCTRYYFGPTSPELGTCLILLIKAFCLRLLFSLITWIWGWNFLTIPNYINTPPEKVLIP